MKNKARAEVVILGENGSFAGGKKRSARRGKRKQGIYMKEKCSVKMKSRVRSRGDDGCKG